MVLTDNGPVVQLVRMPPCHGGDRRFESVLGRQCGSSSVVEHHLAKVGVASSNLVFRSIRNQRAVADATALVLFQSGKKPAFFGWRLVTADE